MAPHCHSRCHHVAHPSASTMCNQSSFGCCCCNNHTAPSQPVIHDSDHLLQSLASLLQCRQEERNLSTRYFPQESQPLKSRYCSKIRVSCDSPHLGESHGVIASLLQRISYLEAAIHQYPHYTRTRCSLREAAARVIQAHFRRFLVRRSRALRNLQDLGRIKGCLLSLRSQVSSKMHFDYADVSLKAMNLMREIELMEDNHPMIRDGRRSIVRDLMSFLDHIQGVSPIITRKSRHSSVSREVNILEDLRNRVEKIDRCRPSVANFANKAVPRRHQTHKLYQNKNKVGFNEDVNEFDVFEDGGGVTRDEFDDGYDYLGTEAQSRKSFKKPSIGYNGDSHLQDESFISSPPLSGKNFKNRDGLRIND